MAQTFSTERQVLGIEDSQILDSVSYLAQMLAYDKSNYGKVERLKREELETERRVFGLESPRTLSARGSRCRA